MNCKPFIIICAATLLSAIFSILLFPLGFAAEKFLFRDQIFSTHKLFDPKNLVVGLLIIMCAAVIYLLSECLNMILKFACKSSPAQFSV